MSVPKNTPPGIVIRCVTVANTPSGTLTIDEPNETLSFAPVSESRELIFDGQRWRVT